MVLVERTCREVSPGNTLAAGGEPEISRPLSHYAQQPAWVLLGPAGAGKTVAFKTEAERTDACYVTARDFLTLNEPAWRDHTLFIDALDEVRAGSQDGRTPLEAIRTKLGALGRPPFRLSCREADWFGASDRTHVAAVSGDGQVVELTLDPLTREDTRALLADRGEDPEAFLQATDQAGLSSLLATPQGLDLLVRAVSSHGWPRSRLETFDLACRQLVQEQNDEHRIAAECTQVAMADLLDSAGKLCAITLLSGRDAVTTAPDPAGNDVLLQDVPGSRPALRAALRTSLFTFTAPRATPIHRHIAEFLAAKHLAELTERGLPPGRVMALMTGWDGGVVSSLRGLCGWLAAHSPKLRPHCIDRDPMATLLYGDVKGFAVDEKGRLVERVKQLAMRDPWCLNNRFELMIRWGDLATPDALPIFQDLLSTLAHDEAGQRLAMAVLLALRDGAVIGFPAKLLVDVARDDERWIEARQHSVAAFIRQHPNDGSAVRQMRALLDDIAHSKVSDPFNGLTIVLLCHLYPKHLSAGELWRYLRQPHPDYAISYGHFWEIDLFKKSTDAQLGEVLDSLTARLKPGASACREMHSRILSKLLEGQADPDPKRLVDWLRKLDRSWDQRVPAALALWLSRNRARGKALLDAAEHMRELAIWIAQLSQHSNVAVPATLGQEPTRKNAAQARLRQRWQAFVRENAAACRDWPPSALQHLAQLHRGMFVEAEGETPRERLRWLLDDDELVAAALDAIRSTLGRNDLPSVAEVAALKPNHPHPLADPFLLALDLQPSSPATPLVSEDHLRLALAFQFAAPGQESSWYAAALKGRARLVASTLAEYCRAAFRAGNASRRTLSALADDASHAEVAELAVVELLRCFPPRCKAEDLPALRVLLSAALRHASRTAVAKLVQHKLSLRSLTAMQRVHWLCCGLTLDADAHIEPLLALLAGRHQHLRIQCVADLLTPHPRTPEDGILDVRALPLNAATKLLRLLAARCPPASILDDPSLPLDSTFDGGRSYVVKDLLAHLAAQPSACATAALERLAANDQLERWLPQLRNAQTRQLHTRREAEFRHVTVDQLLATLRGAQPANVADLAELVADHLAALAARVRKGNTSDWRQYWNTDRKHPTEPKHEELCRDNLLSDLRSVLPEGVTAEPEAAHANDRRADIRIAYKGFAVPVEVKRSDAGNLWKAIRTQLADQYAQDPAAEGHGIYAVFWFGRDRCQRAPEGSKPASASELKERLPQALTPQQRRKIRVVVVDVSLPGAEGLLAW